MTRNSTNTEDKQPRVGKCIDCAKGYVMSDGVKENPLIIECTVTHIRCSQGWICGDGCFSQRKGELEINPMIYIGQKEEYPPEVI